MDYKLFGNSGLRVSELCLGTMGFGEDWGWGVDYQASMKVFDAYAEAGGNFLDTANRYTDGTSEKFLADFVKADRDHFVIATKYSLVDRMGDPNFSGNHRKNLMRSVEGSLKRLDTDHVDVLWLHAWDFTTPVQEVMRGLDDLITSGKVHYIGISDTPAWVVSQANTLAELMGWTQFVGLQLEYSLIQRTPERDLLPMADHYNMAITPWAPLGGGALTGKYLKTEDHHGRIKPESKRRSEWAMDIAKMVVEIAEVADTTPARVALAWVLAQNKKMIPIVGAKKPGQIKDSLGCLDVQLTDEQLAKLDSATAVELGFPHDFLNQEAIDENLFGGIRHRIHNPRK